MSAPQHDPDRARPTWSPPARIAANAWLRVSRHSTLRDQARIDNRKLIDLAAAVVDGHRLLPKRPGTT
jgi:hypothetical protein